MWWDMFTNYGYVELYILYRLMQNQEAQNAGDENGGTHIDRGKFE